MDNFSDSEESEDDDYVNPGNVPYKHSVRTSASIDGFMETAKRPARKPVATNLKPETLSTASRSVSHDSGISMGGTATPPVVRLAETNRSASPLQNGHATSESQETPFKPLQAKAVQTAKEPNTSTRLGEFPAVSPQQVNASAAKSAQPQELHSTSRQPVSPTRVPPLIPSQPLPLARHNELESRVLPSHGIYEMPAVNVSRTSLPQGRPLAPSSAQLVDGGHDGSNGNLRRQKSIPRGWE
jgi:hypothetical protein